MSVDAILTDLQDRWYLDLSMPVIAALIGYVTKLLAIRMILITVGAVPGFLVGELQVFRITH